jgi:hypothetical protein
LAVGSWQWAVGSGQLTVGSWQLAVGSSPARPDARSQIHRPPGEFL